MLAGMELILASQSKYRKELLSKLHVEFTCVSPDIDETPFPGEDPIKLVLRLAQQKAESQQKSFPEHLIIGADIITILNDEIVGKPQNDSEAEQMLLASSDKTITNITGVCVLNSKTKESITEYVETFVTFKKLSLPVIQDYIKKEQPFDNAGALRYQGLGIALIKKIQSVDPTAIVGLPMIKLVSMLEQMAFNVLGK